MSVFNSASDDTSTFANTSCHSWRSAEFGAPPLDVANVSTNQTMSPATRTLLGKRPRGTEETSGDCVEAVHDYDTRGPHKRVNRTMTANGVLEAAGSTSRVRQKLATRTPVQINSKSKALGCEVETFAAPDTQEVYYQFLPGPSVQAELMATTVQAQQPWVEGSEQGTAWHNASSVMQQHEVDGEREDAERDRFRIPKRLSQRHTGLLEATSDNWERGTIRELKCRLCPGAAFGNWEDFKRHCDLMEAHPLKISFCSFCGDFFARTDSLERHCKSRPPQCLNVTPEEAETKRGMTEQVHKEFQERLEHCLETGEDIGISFAQMIKDMYPKSSKRGSRQQSRLKMPKS